MPNDDDRPVWQQCIDRAVLRATCSGQPFSAESILDHVGLVCCPETLTYTRRRLSAIGGANQASVTDADKLAPWDDFAFQERIDAMLAVLLSDLDGLSEEARRNALNARRTWRFLKEAFQRNELRMLLLIEKHKFIRERREGR